MKFLKLLFRRFRRDPGESDADRVKRYVASGQAMFPAPEGGDPPEGYVRVPQMYHYYDGRIEDAFARADGAMMPFVLPGKCRVGINVEFKNPDELGIEFEKPDETDEI